MPSFGLLTILVYGTSSNAPSLRGCSDGDWNRVFYLEGALGESVPPDTTPLDVLNDLEPRVTRGDTTELTLLLDPFLAFASR